MQTENKDCVSLKRFSCHCSFL